jgi:RNA polymerase sigma factor (sigma-70 family)
MEAMTDDSELLRRYAHERSEAAFAELVARHVDLVYSAALRQTQGDHHQAQEVTQMVFTDLARKASALIRHPVLPAWLHRSGHLAALDLRRREGRRFRYERAAGAEAAVTGTAAETLTWEAVGPVLDEALNELDDRDRQAILLRYFGNRPFGEVGQRLRLSENAARMRVERALDKLHGRLAKRGITSSSAALAAALAGQAVVAAPNGVAVASTSAAIAAAGGATGAWVALMSTSKLPLVLTVLLAAGGGAVVAIQERSSRGSAAEMAELLSEDAAIPSLVEQDKGLAAAAAQARSLRDEAAKVAILQGQVGQMEAKADASRRPAAARAPSARMLNLDAGTALWSPSVLDQKPKPLSQSRPEYPPEMRNAGASGQVVVDFVVGTDGLVYNAFALNSSDKAFEDSAVNAVSQWTFSSGQKNGQSVYTHMQVPIVFKLSFEPPPAPTADTWF